MDPSSAVSSERPRWIVSNELICNRLNVLLLHESDPRWKARFQPALKCSEQMLDYQAGQDGVQILRLITRYTYSAFATQTFGMDIPCADDPAIDCIHETGLAQILGTIPGRYMVDIFTWLNYLPPWLKPWEQDARKRFKRDLKWCMDRLERIKDPKFAGQFMPDAFLPSVLRASDQAGFTTQEAAYLSLQLIIGAADTVGYMASFYQLS
ncbi:hypothetical protein BDW71DRAFT_205760 [Aspergillus fruticulosus]